MKRNVLVVDQDHEFITDLREELEKRRCNVFIACDREKAQKAVETRKLQLVILGAITPRGDVFKLHQWIKNRTASQYLPLVVVDLPPEERLDGGGWRRDEGLRLDADDYFCRPIHLSELAVAVKNLLDRIAGKIRVLVVDDHAMFREGICAFLSLQKDVLIVGEAVDGKDAIEKIDQLLPHVVLMDIVMPELNGIEAMKQISNRCRDIRVLILSQYDEEGYITATEQAGAFGFIPKKNVSSELLKAIRTAKRSRNRARYYSRENC